MARKKQKYYVVWQGRKPGVYKSWEECNAQIFEYPQARYKSFETLPQAEKAFKEGSAAYIGKSPKFESALSPERLRLIGQPLPESITVDGAWNTASGDIEYQGVYTRTKELLFRLGPFKDGTNNIAEFLALVHALAYCKQHNVALPIYSDSKIALGWVKGKKAKTNHAQSPQNTKLFELIARAEKWLQQNTYPNQLLKWETKAWGENPADFGRK